MKSTEETEGAFVHLLTSVRVALATLAICCVIYPLGILIFGQIATPETATGSLIRNDQGEIVGSELIAQGFSRPEYFWPRPSAVDYNAAAAGGSNLSPANPALRTSAEAIIGKMGATAENPIPADLVTASGSGLDPDITLEAARHQAPRVARARNLPVSAVLETLDKMAERPGGKLIPVRLVNVLLVNMELDRSR